MNICSGPAIVSTIFWAFGQGWWHLFLTWKVTHQVCLMRLFPKSRRVLSPLELILFRYWFLMRWWNCFLSQILSWRVTFVIFCCFYPSQASFANDSSDDTLDNVDVLQEQLESLPYLCRFQVAISCQVLVSNLRDNFLLNFWLDPSL